MAIIIWLPRATAALPLNIYLNAATAVKADADIAPTVSIKIN